MKNKELVLDKIDRIRNHVKTINYLVNSGGSFDDIRASFDTFYEKLDDIQGLVSVENDTFRTNQLI